VTADDLRYTLREASELTEKSVDTLRRRLKKGQLPGPGSDGSPPRRAERDADHDELITLHAGKGCPGTGIPDPARRARPAQKLTSALVAALGNCRAA
jgi:hypothetical protein